MTDHDPRHRTDRSGESGASAQRGSVDVPLSGSGPLAADPSHRSSPTAPIPNRRTIVAAAVVGGAAAVLAAAALIGLARDGDVTNDGADDDPASAADSFDLATVITTPETLPPLAAASGPGPAATPGRPGVPVREGPLLDQVVVPGYPAAGSGATAAADGFDLATAVARLGDDLPRRSSTRLELGVGGYTREYSVLRDPASDRYEVDAGGLVAVVDDAIGLTFVDVSSPTAERWVSNDHRTVADGFGVARIGVLYDRLLRGPLRPDTIGSASVTPGDLVTLDEHASLARAFTVEIAGDLVPEWQLYALGPTDEFEPSDRPSRLVYTVYVDERDEIRRIVGLSDLGGIPQLIVHDIELLAGPVPIELPDPAVVDLARQDPPGERPTTGTSAP